MSTDSQLKKEPIEVRYNHDGTIDEILFYADDRCVFHLEQMTKRSWYIGLYPKDVEDWAQFYIHSKSKVSVIGS